MPALLGLPLAPVAGSAGTPPGLRPRWCLWGRCQEVTLSISHHTRLPKGTGRGLLLPLWGAEQETEGGMEEGITYADLRLPPTPGNDTLLPAPGSPALPAGPLPSCSPLPSAGPLLQPCSPCSLLSGILCQTAPLQPPCRLPAFGVGGRRGARAADACCTPVPQHTQAPRALLSPLRAKRCLQVENF